MAFMYDVIVPYPGRATLLQEAPSVNYAGVSSISTQFGRLRAGWDLRD